VSDAGDVLFGRTELERAFTALGERLAWRGIVADVFVVGGAAMALAYDANRSPVQIQPSRPYVADQEAISPVR
jgi:hypothetical protein